MLYYYNKLFSVRTWKTELMPPGMPLVYPLVIIGLTVTVYQSYVVLIASNAMLNILHSNPGRERFNVPNA